MNLKKASPLVDEFKFSSPVFRHALRAALAITIAIAVAKGLGLANSVWVPVSVLVVMRPSLGGTLQVSRQRFAGTALGAALGVGLVCLGLPTPVVAGLVILFSFFMFYFKAQNYILFTAALTMVLVLIVGTVFSHTWQGGAERIFDTFLGISIGLASSFLVWPNFARKSLRQEMGDLIAAQHHHFSGLQTAYFSETPDTTGLVSGRIKAKSLLESCTEKFTDASIEPGLRAPQRQELMNLVEIFTRLHSTLTAISSIVTQSTGVFHGSTRPEFEALMDELGARFSDLERYARTGEESDPREPFNTRMAQFMAYLGQLRAKGEFEHFSLDSRNSSSALVRQIHRTGTDLERALTGIRALRSAK